MNLTNSTLLKAIIISLTGWLIIAANINTLPSAFPGFWLEWPPFHPGHWDENTYRILFYIIKGCWLLLLVAYLGMTFDWIGPKKFRTTAWLDRYTEKLADILRNNWNIANQYSKAVKLLAVVWAILMAMTLLTTPYHYDEAWSYHYFSGEGWLRTLSFYPITNNHIFFNLAAVFFDKLLPLDPIIATRLPSLLAAFVASFYFLKLCRYYFSENLSLLLTFLLSSSFPFILYGVEARGYGFQLCFSVLQLYAANQLVLQYRSAKYRLLYFFAFAAGLYTIQSHLYFLAPVHLLLFLYLLRQNKAWLVFILDSFKATAVVAALYGIIAYCNGSSVIFNPVNTAPPEISKLAPAIWEHIHSTWYWLTNSRISIYASLVLLLAPLADLWRRRRKNTWLNVAVSVLLISPPIIVFLHKVIFYVRIWSYMIIPIVLGIGFLLSLAARGFARSSSYQRLQRSAVFYPSVFGLLLIINFSLYKIEHRKEYAIDYTIETLFRKLGPETATAATIYYTRRSLEFYMAEQMVYRRARLDPDRPMTMTAEGTVAGQDILVLDPSISIKELPQLAGYQLAGSYPGGFSLYIRKPGL
jgi:hypothetical protein